MASSFNSYYKTFSGSDTLVFILIPNSTPVLLGNLSTISYSTYRAKNPVSTLGRINVSGFTRGQRVVAGTMIFTIINQHWINELISSLKCFGKFESLKPDELPLFDLMLVSANEYGASMVGTIYGIDITDDSGVISVNDYYTETTVSFLARDIDLFKDGNVGSSNYSSSSRLYFANSYTVELNNVSSFKIEKEAIPHKEDLYSAKDNIINIGSVKIDINNLDKDLVMHNFDKDGTIDVYAKSNYIGNKSNTYLATINSDRVDIKDIISAFVLNPNTGTYPSSIDCIFKLNNEIAKLKIRID